MRADLRSAWRALRAAPGFAVAAVLTLALGIALTAAMGTVARAVAFARLPVRDQDRVAVLWGEQPSLAHVPLGLRQFEAFAASAPGLASVAAVDYNGAWPRYFLMHGPAAAPTRVPQGVVSGNFFDVLGVHPLLGRALRPSDDVPGAPVVAVLSHAAWRRDFDGDPRVVGRTIRSVQDPRLYTIVGVMAPGLDYPRGANLWVALRPMWAPNGRLDSQHVAVDVLARLAPGGTLQLARDALTASYARAGTRTNALAAGTRGTARLLADTVVGDARRAFTLTAAAAALVLVVACVNVAGLVLVRAERRRRELTVRAAIGAGRGRLVTQLLAEYAILAAVSGALGAGLAAVLVRTFAALAPADLPRVAEVHVDGTLLAAATLATAVVVLFVGLLPAVSAARRVDLADVLRSDVRAGTGGPRAHRGRQALVAAQVALAVVILAAATLLGRSFARLRAVDFGMAADHLALVQLVPPPELLGAAPPRGASAWNALLDRMIERVGTLPGVIGVAPVSTPPFLGSAGWIIRPAAEGVAVADTVRTPWLHMEVTTGDFARAAGVPLLRGRFLTAADREGAPGVVVLSERAARMIWPGADAVGKRVNFGAHDPFGWRTVVGVVGETRWQDLSTPQPAIYIPYRQFEASPTVLLVRATGDPALLLPAVRRAVSEAAPGVTVTAANTIRELTAAPLARPRLLSALLGAFAFAAVALTAVGLFGVVAAFAGGRLLGALLYDVRPADPLALGGSAIALLAVCAAASLGPARRASRVDPASALRAE